MLTYLPTHTLIHPPILLPVHLFIYLFIYILTHLFTYLLIIYTMLMSTNVWHSKFKNITLNNLTTILIIFNPLMSINGNLACEYYTSPPQTCKDSFALNLANPAALLYWCPFCSGHFHPFKTVFFYYGFGQWLLLIEM